jgi:AAA ATPase domain
MANVYQTAQGFATHLASILQELPSGGAIYVSETVRQQAAGSFCFNDLGEFTLSEVAQSMRIYECTGEDRANLRLEALLCRHVSAFLGREHEMALLNALWTRAHHGQGQVLYFFGEAGVGKSRLAYEFQRTLTEARTLQAQTMSYGQAMPLPCLHPLAACPPKPEP